MEKIAKYKSIVQEELEYRQSIKIYNGPRLQRHLIVNESQTEFILLNVGWFNKRYLSGVVFHIEIKDDKVWVHKDNTDVDIAEVLARQGIPKKDIVLAFLPSYTKGMTEYAVV